MFGPVATNDPGSRYGIGQTALATVQTSMAQPVEVCGVRGQLMWLMSARCADGSAPFKDPGVAHSARAGSMGAGGQCGSIIDLYQVPCPETTYSVYMDLYVCGPGESIR